MPIRIKKQFGPMFIPNAPEMGNSNLFVYEIEAADAEELKQLAKAEMDNLKEVLKFMKEMENSKGPQSILEPKKKQKLPDSVVNAESNAESYDPDHLRRIIEGLFGDIEE